MKQEENENARTADFLPELEAELAQMAEEVPPVPADFHDRWMKAIREDAEKQQENPAGRKQGKAVPFARGPWSRLISVAAMFVFLIGGTMLYRAGKGNIAPKVEMQGAGTIPAETEAPAATAPPVIQVDAEEAGEAMYGEAAEVSEPANPASGGMAEHPETDAEEAGEAAFETGEAYEAPRPQAITAGGAAEYSRPDNGAQEAEESEAYEAESAAEVPAANMSMKSAANRVETAAETAAEAVPAATAGPTPVPAEQPKTADSAEKTENAPGFFQQAGGFLSAMGAFVISIWPWIAAAAVVTAAVLMVKRRKTGK